MMNFKKYPSLSRAAAALTKRGFADHFKFEDRRLKHRESGRLYEPNEVAIVEYHRFTPKKPETGKTSIVFALETFDQIRGLLVASYQAYGKVHLLEFMDRVKIKSRKRNVA